MTKTIERKILQAYLHSTVKRIKNSKAPNMELLKSFVDMLTKLADMEQEWIGECIGEGYYSYILNKSQGAYYLARVDYDPKLRDERVTAVFNPLTNSIYEDSSANEDIINDLYYDIKAGTFDSLLV